jgi:cell wall-associated NlpC family hydrolase
VAQNFPGRHRAPGRFSAISELKSIAKESAQPAVKGAVIVAASGGLVASFAGTANAAESKGAVVTAAQTVSAPSAAVVGPQGASVQASTALSSIGFAARTAAKTAPVKPRVIRDIAVETQRREAKAAAAKAKADAARAKAAAAKAKADAGRARAAAAREAAAARSAAPARRSTTATRSTSAHRTTTATRARVAATRTTTARSTTSRSTTRTAINPAPRTPAPAPRASGIVGIAQSLMGIPYVWGGSTTSGFDCSGFTSYVYRQAGITIPRTAGAQKRATTPVSSPRPGDLVFFGYPVYHVGIYVSPGTMIDAQRPGTTIGYHSIWTTPSGYGRV